MINKLWNSKESTTKSWSNLWKKAAALLLALTLSGQPAESKTFEKQEFPTEMVAYNPWEYSPMTENVEQTSVPNYINQAKNWVRKYYPQYEEYFNQIFTKISWLKAHSHNLINSKIDENFDLFDEELTSEKDKITTILLVLEKIIIWKNQLERSISWNIKGRGLIEIAEGISDDITQQSRVERDQSRVERDQSRVERDQSRVERDQSRVERDQSRVERDQSLQRHNKIKNRNDKIVEIINYINSSDINRETISKIIDKIEEYFTLFEAKEIKEDQGLQKIIKHYINYTRQINRKPSDTWKKFIDEYNKINNK